MHDHSAARLLLDLYPHLSVGHGVSEETVKGHHEAAHDHDHHRSELDELARH